MLVLRELNIMGVGVILSVLHGHVSVRDALNKELSLDNLTFESLMAIIDWTSHQTGHLNDFTQKVMN